MKRFTVCILISVILLLLLSGCCFGRVDQRIVLWTASPEFAAYAQVFNKIQEEYVVEVVYKDSAALSLLEKKSGRCDVAIGPFLNYASLEETFIPLESLFLDGIVSKEHFYQSALEKGARNGSQKLLPLSFNVPAFIFQSGKIKPEFNSLALTSSAFSSICMDFNNAKSRHAKSAFSPLWNPESLFFFSFLSPGLCSQFETKYGIDQQDIENGLSRVRRMIVTLGGGFLAESRFREKYLYKNYLELLDSGHIFFWYSDVGSFYTLPAERRRNLDFRYYLNEDDKIAVCEDMLWMGIPKKGENTMGAFAFINWLMDPDVQQELILKAREQDIRSFGFAGGFSAIKTVNSEALQQIYPFISTFIPHEEYLAFPDPCPPDWHILKRGVVLPYLEQECRVPETSRQLWEAEESWRRMNVGR